MANIIAQWNESLEAYITGDFSSPNGNDWINNITGQADAPDGVIKLVGGPRDGEEVG